MARTVRTTALVSTTALALGLSLLASAAPAAAADTAPTPHLDSVEQTLRQVSPGLEGSVWERTAGNRLGSSTPGAADWLLQTPGCWGDAACTDRPGTRRLLDKIRQDIAAARETVDISTLAPFPDGGYQDAIVAGLKESAHRGNRLKVRVLVGAAPVYHSTVIPSSYRNELLTKLGPDAAAGITLNVASMTTSKTAFSWNHSKLVVVDGSSVITGGINSWKGDYLETSHPVSDVDLALSGPAAGSAGRYLDSLWDWTCRNRNSWSSVWFAASPGADCMPSLPRPAAPWAGATRPRSPSAASASASAAATPPPPSTPSCPRPPTPGAASGSTTTPTPTGTTTPSTPRRAPCAPWSPARPRTSRSPSRTSTPPARRCPATTCASTTPSPRSSPPE
ncbi:hypothetical protein [Streptomyces sp. 3211]|uniref:hypothetical protein n=1 Tax=Streptomyces sp. 3211 TaxID=1964449 RepID=UPI001F421F75|nr:hypothetical protein [Streptomyces sp. 3211]